MTTSTRPIQAPRQRPGSRGSRGPKLPESRAGFSSRQLYLGAAALAALLAAALVALSLMGGNSSRKASTSIVGVAATTDLLSGIPQHGVTIGSPSAPYRLVEYADIQCPYCGDWARDAFPAVVNHYVRSGKLQIEFRGMTFVGADSKPALETALAAGQQNRFWNVVDLLYRNQGTENTGWASDSLLRGVLGAVPGLDASRAVADRSGSAVAAGLERAARLAAEDGITQTPTFEFGAVGETLQPLQVTALDASFVSTLAAAMKG